VSLCVEIQQTASLRAPALCRASSRERLLAHCQVRDAWRSCHLSLCAITRVPCLQELTEVVTELIRRAQAPSEPQVRSHRYHKRKFASEMTCSYKQDCRHSHLYALIRLQELHQRQSPQGWAMLYQSCQLQLQTQVYCCQSILFLSASRICVAENRYLKRGTAYIASRSLCMCTQILSL
jgi:hypothetical protein